MDLHPHGQAVHRFLAEAKKQGFHVVIDGVFNHVGTGHPAFQDVKAHGRTSRFADWFDIKTWEPFTYDAWWGFSELPVFKKDPEKGLASKTAREHIFAVTQRWMDPNGDGDPSDGVDGWRLDVPNEVPLPFWWEWRTLVKKINPNAYISGEIWDRAEAYLDGRAFDGVMNYEFAKPAVQWVANQKQKITASGAGQAPGCAAPGLSSRSALRHDEPAGQPRHRSRVQHDPQPGPQVQREEPASGQRPVRRQQAHGRGLRQAEAAGAPADDLCGRP
ncbi:MAG: alpha-amylase family glycosyl hydrolase [Phycisphaerales bacterium]